MTDLPNHRPTAVDAVTGVLLGGAVGDALGLPREGLSPERARRLFGDPPLKHRFLLGRGMTSDDTEHACLVGQSLLRQPYHADRFARSLAWGLRWWLLALPGGVGWATLRAVGKLWLGFPPGWSGVFSAGNGPAMRAPLLGVCLGHDPDQLRAFLRASTRLTHTDPRAERGAWLVACAAHHSASRGAAGVNGMSFLEEVARPLGREDAELPRIVETMAEHLAREAPCGELAATLGLSRGVTGYIYHTVPIALYCWLRWPGDVRRAVEETIVLGGDTDTTAAITGALVGAATGPAGIPPEWLAGLWEWPRSVAWMRSLAERLAGRMGGDAPRGPVPLFWPTLPARNLLFLLVVLGHGFRRLLPPY